MSTRPGQPPADGGPPARRSFARRSFAQGSFARGTGRRPVPDPDADTSLTAAQAGAAARAVLAHLPLIVVLWFVVRGLAGVWDEVRLRAGDRRYEAVAVGGYAFLRRTTVAPDGPRWQAFSQRYGPGDPDWRNDLRFEPVRRFAGFAVGHGPYEPAYRLDAARTGSAVPPADREVVRVPLYAPLLPAAAPAAAFWARRLAAARRAARPGHCPDCGYPLHGLRAPRCPECGRSLAR